VTNQRQHERISITIAVVVTHEGADLQAETRNVSAGGMLLESRAPVPFGAAVRVRAKLAGQDIDIPATVRWVQGTAIGVQFGSLRAKETWAINQLVKQAHK